MLFFLSISIGFFFLISISSASSKTRVWLRNHCKNRIQASFVDQSVKVTKFDELLINSLCLRFHPKSSCFFFVLNFISKEKDGRRQKVPRNWRIEKKRMRNLYVMWTLNIRGLLLFFTPNFSEFYPQTILPHPKAILEKLTRFP